MVYAMDEGSSKTSNPIPKWRSYFYGRIERTKSGSQIPEVTCQEDFTRSLRWSDLRRKAISLPLPQGWEPAGGRSRFTSWSCCPSPVPYQATPRNPTTLLSLPKDFCLSGRNSKARRHLLLASQGPADVQVLSTDGLRAKRPGTETPLRVEAGGEQGGLLVRGALS